MLIKVLKELFHSELDKIYSKEEVFSFFHMLCEAYLDKSRLELALIPNLELTPEQETLFLKALEQLKRDFPIQYIIGNTEFMDLTFEVNENVLIPRPETEELIYWILESSSKEAKNSILDIGTGSGCIPIALVKNLPNSIIETMDVSEKALTVAKRNALAQKVNIKFIHHDILQLNDLDHDYDIIVSNPPYVRESEKNEMHDNVLKYEPDVALYVSDHDPLIFYKHIAKLAIKRLKKQGYLYFEINQYLGEQLYQILNNLGFEKIEIKKDLYGADRMIRAVKN
ncbi:MAG: peptide chain release factor N(5)-glutamine methyltransferase [Flavobacteriales bacterium]|nr:peptide chain release factor N(5)-glutamine methyltransferase [Flavobacteriales bacterium]